MTENTRITIASHPDVNLQLRIKPLDFQIGGEASLGLTTGSIHFKVEEIPVHIAVPFLRRRVNLGSVGPFGVQVKPFEAKLDALGVSARVTFGKEWAEAGVHATGNCKAEIDVDSDLAKQIIQTVKKPVGKE
jgi:hypothetical protein